MRTRGWVLLAVLATLALAVALYFRPWASEPTQRLVTASVERSRVVSTVLATGTLNALKTVLVGTYVSGPITEIDVDYNSPVSIGQRVAKIDPRPFVVKVKQAEAQLATARARVARAEADLSLQSARLQRQRRLRAEQVVSIEELDATESAFRQAEAQRALELASVAQAAAAVDEARVNLAYTDIVSPVDGIVLSRNVDVGQTVAATFQTPTLFVIAEDLTKMQVTASVSEADIGPMRPGLVATFTVDAHPDREFAGVVSQVRQAPVSVENVVTYDVVIDVENDDRSLKPGMTANVTIIAAVREDVLAVPARALRFRPDDVPDEEDRDDGARLWRVGREDELVPVRVELGLRGEILVELKAGDFEAGDRVALGYERAGAGRPE